MEREAGATRPDRYLASVLTLSTLPRIVTSLLSVVSYPVMVRAVGPSQLGMLVIISAVIQTLESFVDMGVSSAAGRSIAAARVQGMAVAVRSAARWARLQAVVAFIGLVPLLLVTYLVSRATLGRDVQLVLVASLVLGTWLTIGLNFGRACLTSLLRFKHLAILDVTQSVLRSAGFLGVAAFVPTALGLAASNLVVVILALVVMAVIFRTRPTVAGRAGPAPAAEVRAAGGELSTRGMIRESMAFLWLRLSVRSAEGIPLIILGRNLGPDVVGIIGAVRRLLEYLNFPWSVIGIALGARAREIVSSGEGAVRGLWSALWRFLAVLLVIGSTAVIGADILAVFLLPNDPGYWYLMPYLAPLVTVSGAALLLTPISDYIGGLRWRNILMTVYVVLSAPVIHLVTRGGNELAGVVGYVALLTVLSAGFFAITRMVLHGGRRSLPDRATLWFAGAGVGVLGLVLVLRHWIPLPAVEGLAVSRAGVWALLYMVTVLLLVAGRRSTRYAFLSPRLLTIDRETGSPR